MDPADLFRLMIIASILLLILYTLSGHVIDSLKILVLHESTVGVLTGALIQYMLLDYYIIKFDSQSFFFFMLPPIVFASAYTLKKKNFVRNIDVFIMFKLPWNCPGNSPEMFGKLPGKSREMSRKYTGIV